MASVVYTQNDHVLTVTGLSTIILATGATTYLDETAEVEVTLTDMDGEELEGEDWPMALTYREDTDGVFYAVVRDSIVWPSSGRALAQLVADFGTDQHGELTGRLLVRTQMF